MNGMQWRVDLRFALAGLTAAAIVGAATWATGCSSSPSLVIYEDDAPSADGGAMAEGGASACDGGARTLRGIVNDPAGLAGVYNAIVYVPSTPLEPMVTGASCERCGRVSGAPIASALTNAKGEFELRVPMWERVPLVVQIGKWRRLATVELAGSTACSVTVPSESLRLPRNKAEGDIPLMAIATGSADPFECLLLKMGIDASEFTSPEGTGRVHFYTENGQYLESGSPPADRLTMNRQAMMGYDTIFLPCESEPHDKPDAADQNLLAYVNAGGRAFTTHFGYQWLAPGYAPKAFNLTGQWDTDAQIGSDDSVTGIVNQSFPKGKAFAEWLKNVGASSKLGEIELFETRRDLIAANTPPSVAWIGTQAFGGATLHMTFNTPVLEPESNFCGRMVYSDFHVSAQALDPTAYGFPGACLRGELTPQEKALEFMIFDLASCIQSDTAKPEPPVVK